MIQNTQEPVKIYIDYFSQPSRAILSLLRLKNIPHQVIETRLAFGDNQKKEYLNKAPTGKVPLMTHNNIAIIESSAILRYISNQDGGLKKILKNLLDFFYKKNPFLYMK